MIHPQTTLGHVHLTVANLDRALAFYQQNLGLQMRRQQGRTAYLGAGGPDLLLLTKQLNARFVSGVTGLYHLAILTPFRHALAQSLRRLVETRTPLQGFSDHGVSEAIYLSDPDGNGLEIYRDRSRSEWPRRDGLLNMVMLPLDVADLMALEPVEPWAGLPPQTILGHIHLHVAAIPPAETFYTNVLGFDLMQRYGPSASFTSAGGYHHHIAFNVRQVANLFPGLSENPKFNACDRRPLTADRRNTGKSLNLAAVCRRSSAVNWLKSYFRKALNLSPLALLF